MIFDRRGEGGEGESILPYDKLLLAENADGIGYGADSGIVEFVIPNGKCRVPEIYR